ncbi:FecR family protein [Novosphingobium sp. YAF33]|uniref:FecR family protein n=1 Tax=Novosphingobium sp. YAF33 TaxID=3233082 RepID=UPI003F9DD1BF
MSIEQEAADWFAVMRGPDAEASYAAFEAWRMDPARAQAYEEKLRAWDTTMFLANTATGKRRGLDGVGQRKFAPQGWARAAAAFLAVGVGAMLAIKVAGGLDAQTGSHRLVSAAMDEAPRTIHLPDGSNVTLDRGARLQLAFDEGGRRLRLLAGRARFSVAHDTSRPFIVEAGGGSVEAHGTLFDVALLPGAAADVSLLQGAVEVRSVLAGRRGVDLKAGESISFAGGTLGKPRAIIAATLQWPRDMIMFDGMDLVAAAAAFNLTSPTPVVIEGGAAAGMRITGSFRRSDPEAFARQAALTFGLVVKAREEGTLALVRPGSEESQKRR